MLTTRTLCIGAVLVFLFCLAVRIYYIEQKHILEGDELTSYVIALDAKGWYGNDYEVGTPYTGEDVRKNVFTDNIGGVKGYVADMKTLWEDNRDGLHSSLYYMLLRTMLCVNTGGSMKSAIWLGCGLNLLFFTFQFFVLWKVLLLLFRKERWLILPSLLFVFLSPVAISMNLLVREYQMACLAVLIFIWMALRIQAHLEEGAPLCKPLPVINGGLAVAFLISSGFFNAIPLLFVLSFLGVKAYCKRRKDFVLYAAAVALLGILFCGLTYKGFFNVLTDWRLTFVLDKSQEMGMGENLAVSLFFAIYYLSLYILTPVMSILLFLVVVKSFFKNRNITGFLKDCPEPWIFLSIALWYVLIPIFSPWKTLRYVSPAAFLLMVYVLWICANGCRKYCRVCFTLAVVASLAYTLFGNRVMFLEAYEKESLCWDKSATRIYLYAPNAEEGMTLTQLAPHLEAKQNCVLVEDWEQMVDAVNKERMSVSDTTEANSESAVYLVAAPAFEELRKMPGYEASWKINQWQCLLRYNRDSVKKHREK